MSHKTKGQTLKQSVEQIAKGMSPHPLPENGILEIAESPLRCEHSWGIWQGYRVTLPDGYQKWKFRVCETCGERDKDVLVYTTDFEGKQK